MERIDVPPERAWPSALPPLPRTVMVQSNRRRLRLAPAPGAREERWTWREFTGCGAPASGSALADAASAVAPAQIEILAAEDTPTAVLRLTALAEALRASDVDPVFDMPAALADACLATPESPFDAAAGGSTTLPDLRLIETSDGWSLHTQADAIDLATARHLATAAAALQPGPSRRPRLWPTDEQQRQLLAWGRGPEPAETFEFASVCAAFQAQVQRAPQAIAVMATEGADTVIWTYQELDHRARRVAAGLIAQGVQPGELVATALGRGPSTVAALLGILMAGCAYLPLDARYPAERLVTMRRAAAARHVLTQHQAEAAFAGAGIDAEGRLDLDELLSFAPAETDHVAGLANAAHSGDPTAYVMFTSGSTGTPKGISIGHRAILRLVMAAGFVPLDAKSRVLQAAPIGFDASTFEIWGPLLNGGCCVVHPEELPTPAGLARTMADHGVNTAFLTSALFNTVVDTAVSSLGTLRHLIAGGEALSVPHVRRAQAAHPHLKIVNGYGPTECTTFAATHPIPADLAADARSVPIGSPINHTVLRVLDAALEPVLPGLVGELFIGGLGLSAGYVGRSDLTAERFIADPFGPAGARLYRTGDRVRWDAEGRLVFCGRADAQVKIRGFRIELGDVEATLALAPGVKAAAAAVHPGPDGSAQLVAYLVGEADDADLVARVRQTVAERLPRFMHPAFHVRLAALPTTPNGKLDRRALPPPNTARITPDPHEDLLPAGEAHSKADVTRHLEAELCRVLAGVLGVPALRPTDRFFEHGGHSLAVLRAIAAIEAAGLGSLSTHAFYSQDTPRALAAALSTAVAPAGRPSGDMHLATDTRPIDRLREPIAIIGMAGRFPGAASVEALWQMLVEGREGITRFADTELDPSLPADLVADPLYVKARGVIDGVEDFDAAFFGFSPREADLTDPQHRVFLEIAWECLERAGHAPDATTVPVGVFAGMYHATYFQRHLQPRPDLIAKLGEFAVMLGNEKDFIATRAAHRLNLRGPAVSVNTACSTSLVAIAQAVQALRAGQCGMALAGGVSITCPWRSGHRYEEGSMLSPDGHTRSFDAQAGGTVFSDGAAVVLLKRLSDALADGDTVHALIRGVAVNNDGRHKASFSAPSVDGQAAVIVAAQADAGVAAHEIGYVETHGTATPLGDPIEVEALRRAWQSTAPSQDGATGRAPCSLGSVKSNVGHLVIAAGAAGVIKTALSLTHESLPASLHLQRPNPALGLERGPFHVQQQRAPWPRSARPRFAGVSSFGVGGTNAHAVMQEAPMLPEPAPAAGLQTLLLTARTPSALAAMGEQMAAHLGAQPGINLADVAHTLQHGRSRFVHRLAVVAATAADAADALHRPDSAARVHGSVSAVDADPPSVVLLFPGQGSQTARIGLALAAADPVFRAAFDEALAALEPHVSGGLRTRLEDPSDEALAPTALTQPALFAIEWAMARRWIDAGVKPAALIGHSVGEFAAACIAGVMTLADGARLVALRGALMQAQPPGSMLQVRLSVQALLERLPPELDLAADNAPKACVVAGPAADIDAFAARLQADGVSSRVLRTSHAFHSRAMDPAIEPFRAAMAGVALQAPKIPIVSTLTGTWLSADEATNPSYWARHLREPVRFSRALSVAIGAFDAALLETGPSRVLTQLALQHAALRAVSSGADARGDEVLAMTRARAQLWAWGLEPKGSIAQPPAARRRIVLPTYPFERQRHWVDTPAARVPTHPLAATHAAAFSPLSTPPVVSPMSSMSPSAPSLIPDAARQVRLVAQLRALCEDIAGTDLQQADATVPFVELGLDSLTLTQVALQVKKQFKVPVTFRQLMESHGSLDALARHLDATLPAEPMASATVPATTIPAAIAMPLTAAAAAWRPNPGPAAPSGFLQQLIQQQMQLMGQQLALLGAAPPVTATPETVATATSTTPMPAASQPTPSPSASTPTNLQPEPMRYDVKKAFGAIARIHTATGPISQRQRARLDAFIRRYTERTTRSKAFTERHRPHLADPRVVNGFRPLTKEITYQIVVDRSRGARLWDLDGHEYVDVLNGFGMNLFGWSPDFVQAAVREQLDRGYEIGPQHPLAAEVADLVCELTGFDRAGLCNTGSEAVMAAIRIARTVTGRSTVALFTGSYHGTFDEVLVRAGRAAKGIPAAPGIMAGAFGDVRVLDYGTPESLAFIREHADDLAAVLVEPVQSRRPEFQPTEFLRDLRRITAASGTCLIFDEVITGFRAHLGGAQAHFGVRADLASYGKVIGGGFPIGVIAGRRDFMDALDGGSWQYGDDSVPTVGVTYFAGTFVRHPLAMAAAKAALLHLKHAGPALQTQLNTTTAALASELSAWCREVGAPIEIRHFASLWRVSWLEDHPLQDLLFAMMRSRGVHILDNFPCFLTTAHTPQDVALIKTAFKESVAELQEAEFLPAATAAPAATLADPNEPPAPNARLGRDKDGRPAWFVPDPDAPGKFKRLAITAS